MKADLAKLRALHEAATPGPWLAQRRNGHLRTSSRLHIFDSRLRVVTEVSGSMKNSAQYEATAALIVAMRNEIGELIAIAEAVERAPVGWCIGQCGPDFVSPETGAVIQMDNPAQIKGKRVRILAIGEDG